MDYMYGVHVWCHVLCTLLDRQLPIQISYGYRKAVSIEESKSKMLQVCNDCFILLWCHSNCVCLSCHSSSWPSSCHFHQLMNTCTLLGINLHSPNTFVQQFITNPLLIDGRYVLLLLSASPACICGYYLRIATIKGYSIGIDTAPLPRSLSYRKFDIGLYTVITSVDPLRVYVYNEEILLR